MNSHREPLRIAIHDFGGYPFPAQLSRTLASRGHDVLYLHAGGLRAPRGGFAPRQSDPPTLTMSGVGLSERLHSRAGPRRLLQERRYGKQLEKRIRGHRPDVVLSGTGSLEAHQSAQRAAHEIGAAFAFWIQDIYSVAINRLLGRRLPLLGRAISIPYSRLEQRLLRASDAVIATSADFLPLLRAWRIPAERTTVVENWAPLDEVSPLSRDNPWARSHGLVATQVLLYAGTLGRKHDPRLLLALAEDLPAARVVAVSEGAGTDLLRRIAAGHPNLTLLPLQPASDLPEVLATADVLVALLEHDAHTFSVPSKVLTYLTAGRPILAAIPSANLAARTIEAAHAGIVVDPADRDGFVAGARELLSDPGRRDAAGQGARKYAETNFDIERIADRFESIFDRARRERRSRTPLSADTANSSHDQLSEDTR